MQTDFPNWVGSGNHCEWNGVTCDVNYRVTSVSLENNLISGGYPSDLRSLSELSNVDLSGNALTGSVPSALCDSTSVTITGDETNCPNAVGISGCCDAVRLTSPSPYLNGIVESQLGSSVCGDDADGNACSFMESKANHDVFTSYPADFPYENWLQVS